MGKGKTIVDLASKRRKQVAKEKPKEKSRSAKIEEFVKRIGKRYPNVDDEVFFTLCNCKWYDYMKTDESVYFQEMFAGLQRYTISAKDLQLLAKDIEEYDIGENDKKKYLSLLEDEEVEDLRKRVSSLSKLLGKYEDNTVYKQIANDAFKLLYRETQHKNLLEIIAKSKSFDEVRNFLPQYIDAETRYENYLEVLKEDPIGRKADKPCKYCGCDEVYDDIKQTAGFDEATGAKEKCVRCKQVV